MIDPQIALSVRPVQTENPLDLFARLSAIKGQQQQQKINALSLLSAQRQLEEEDAVKAAVQAAGGDVSNALPAIMQASPKSGIGLSRSLAEQRTAQLAQQKTELDIHDRNFKRLGSMAAAVNTTEDLNRFLSEGVNLKVLDPQTAQQIAAQGLTTGTMQWLDARTKEAMTVSEQLAARRFELEDEMRRAANSREQGEAQRKELMFPAQRQKAEAEAALAALKAEGKEPIQPGEQARIDATKSAAEQARDRLEEQKRHNKAMEAKPTGGATAYPVTPGMQSSAATGEEFLAELKKTSPGLAAKVKAIAEGRDSIPTGRAAVTGAGKQIADAVYQYDPEFSQQRAQIRKARTTGKAADNIGSLNTAIVHLDQFAQAAEALKNGNFKAGNAAYNYLADQFGAGAIGNFELMKATVAGEMANALKGNATDIEIHNISQSIMAANSPEKFKGAVQTAMRALHGKLGTYDERFKLGESDNWSATMPRAKSVLKKYGIGEQAGQPGAGAPKVKVWNPKTNRFE